MQVQRLLLNSSTPQTLKDAVVYVGRPMSGWGQTAPSIIPEKISKPVVKAYDDFIEFLARGIGKLAGNKQMQKFIKSLEGTKYTEHLSAVCANILNGFYLYNVYKSKKIEDNQKAPLMTNMMISTILSTLGGYALNKQLFKQTDKIGTLIKANYKNCDNMLTGLKIAQGLMVFQLLYRFVAPVIATPIANHISNKIREKNGNVAKLPA